MLELIVPDISHKVEWEKIMKEWDDSRKRPRIFFQDSYEQFMEKISRISYSDDIENQVPRSSIFFLLDTESNKIIGFYWLRHNLNFRNDAISSGHIGYGIRPSERGKGYAKEGLKLLFDKAKEIIVGGKVLIACDDDNTASAKVIESNGGVFESYIHTKEGIKRRRYWITIS